MMEHRSPIPYMTLAWLAGAWIAGISSAAVPAPGALPLALALAATTLAIALVRRERAIAIFAIALPLIFVGGVVRYEHTKPHLALDAAAHLNGGPAVRARGVLRGDPSIGDTSQQFTVDL